MVTPESTDPVIALVVESDDLRERLRGALAGSGHLRDAHELGADDPVDVLVTDALSQTLDELLPRCKDSRRSCAVVRIGQGAGDVVLPGDFSDRELTTACRLLSEIVRLHRGRRDAMQSRGTYRRLALTDALTGLANRRAWDQETKNRLADAAALSNPHRGLCLALIDLDHFARVNAEHGHATGDEVLKAAAAALQSGVRADDLVARLGGDEFALLAGTSTRATAEQLCDRLRQDVAATLAERAVGRVTVSVGGTWTNLKNTDSAAELYAKTSSALRQAKEAGRDRTVMG